MIDPLRGVPDYAQGALENTPEIEAVLEGADFVPQTWGNIVSKLVEQGIYTIDPDNPQASYKDILGRMGLRPHELTEFVNLYDATAHYLQLEHIHTAEAKVVERELVEQLQGFSAHMVALYDRCLVEDGDERIDALLEKVHEAPAYEDSTKEQLIDTKLMITELEALESGYRIPLTELYANIFGYSGELWLEPHELQRYLSFPLRSLMNRRFGHDYETVISDIPANEVYVGSEFVAHFMTYVESSIDGRALDRALEVTDAVKFTFRKPRLRNDLRLTFYTHESQQDT